MMEKIRFVYTLSNKREFRLTLKEHLEVQKYIGSTETKVIRLRGGWTGINIAYLQYFEVDPDSITEEAKARLNGSYTQTELNTTVRTVYEELATQFGTDIKLLAS